MISSTLLTKATRIAVPVSILIVYLFAALVAFGQDDASVSPACPNCKSNTSVVHIAYGKPGPELKEQAKEGKVHLGGCSPKKEKWYCKNCKFRF